MQHNSKNPALVPQPLASFLLKLVEEKDCLQSNADFVWAHIMCFSPTNIIIIIASA